MTNDLFLLSIEEYEKYKNVIPNVINCWWLRSPGYCSDYASYVFAGGSVNTRGSYVDHAGGIRPALKVKKSEVSNLQIGERKIYYEFPFVKIDKNLMISEVPITFKKFDDKCNVYEGSYVKQFLDNWKNNRKR